MMLVEEACHELVFHNVEVVDYEAVARCTLMNEDRLELVSQLSTCLAERVKTDSPVEYGLWCHVVSVVRRRCCLCLQLHETTNQEWSSVTNCDQEIDVVSQLSGYAQKSWLRRGCAVG